METITHNSAFGDLTLAKVVGSKAHYKGIATCPMEALCFLHHCQGGVIHDFSREHGYDFTQHIGQPVEVAQDGAGRYATFETDNKIITFVERNAL